MKSVRVLFVGNSHTFFNDMPSIFQMFCKETGAAEAEVVMQAHPGVHLEWHLNQQWELRYALVQGKFDYLVFQQAAHPFPPREETLRDAAKMVELAKACGTVPVATIPWAERRFPESQQERYDTFDLVGEQTGVTLSPVGYVFERVEREEKDIDLYFVDGEHASPYGSYVIAACAFNRIFGKSVIGLPYKSICNVRRTGPSLRRSPRCARRPPASAPSRRNWPPWRASPIPRPPQPAWLPRPTSSPPRHSPRSGTGRSSGWTWTRKRPPACSASSWRRSRSSTPATPTDRPLPPSKKAPPRGSFFLRYSSTPKFPNGNTVNTARLTTSSAGM